MPKIEFVKFTRHERRMYLRLVAVEFQEVLGDLWRLPIKVEILNLSDCFPCCALVDVFLFFG